MKERGQSRESPEVALELDLIKLSAFIKERQSSLILLLEERRQKSWQRPEWLLRQCEHQSKENRLTRQIRGIVLRWVLFDCECSRQQITKHIRQFWLKVKMVMKMSLERMKVLDFLSYSLFQRFQTIIDATNTGYDRALGLYLYRDIEQMIRSRNRLIHDLLQQSFSQKLIKNISDFVGNSTAKVISVESSTWKIPLLKKRQHQTLEPKSKRRPFSDQSQRKGRMKLNNILHSKKMKKIENKLNQFEDTLINVMDARIDATIDKKKTLEGNIDCLYNQILNRNIGNQKDIQKFIFRHHGSFLPKLKHRPVTRPQTPILLRKNRKIQSSKVHRKDHNNMKMKQLGENHMLMMNLDKIAKRKYKQKKPEKQLQKKKRMALKNI